MICPKCSNAMKNTMHFEEGRQYQFNECSNCHEKTKNKRIHFEDVLKKEVDKYKKN
jgi:DNA-directed RNA polymerase subunit M/transcription elongation factor TFIIS